MFEHLSALLSNSTQYSALLIERAVVCLLRLCHILAQKVSNLPPFPSHQLSIYNSLSLPYGTKSTSHLTFWRTFLQQLLIQLVNKL
jgi:hypothetical protein